MSWTRRATPTRRPCCRQPYRRTPTSQPPHISLTGDIPSPTELPEGCFFYSRCAYRSDPRCATENPPLREVAPGHWTATFCDVGETASD